MKLLISGNNGQSGECGIADVIPEWCTRMQFVPSIPPLPGETKTDKITKETLWRLTAGAAYDFQNDGWSYSAFSDGKVCLSGIHKGVAEELVGMVERWWHEELRRFASGGVSLR